MVWASKSDVFSRGNISFVRDYISKFTAPHTLFVISRKISDVREIVSGDLEVSGCFELSKPCS